MKHKDINQLSEIETTNTRLKVAGLPALSRISNLANTEEVYATSLKVFKESIEDSIMSNKEVFEVNIGNRVELELWSYSPFSLSNDRFVDPISLYFSLKDSDDPRIEMELDELLYKIKQSLE